MNAAVFSSSIDANANGYIPQHKEPPRYIKVRAHDKKIRHFNRMFLAQELVGKPASGDDKAEAPEQSHKLQKQKTSGPVWATEFSKDGRYLAAAGRDQVVRVWAVISTPEERQAHEHEEDASSATGGERLSAPVFRSTPVREFKGHTSDILDLSWSKNNFLLSSSMDKTVRLWHISRQECLCTFKHKDFVTSIAFHPTDDRFFLAGSLDSVLRLWSIPDKTVAFWNQLPDLITAVAFSPDGKTAIAGVLSGLCLFYETEGLKYHTQIHVRSSRGKNAKGSKITGIRTITFPPEDPDGDIKVLITSNDSRIRMYNLRDKSLEMKFRGLENTSSQINATFSDSAEYIICGSEDRKAYIWSTASADPDKDKRALEYFEAHSDIVTTAVMAPTKSRQLLSTSGDPIYDLCNPPPVTLVSREESSIDSKRQSDPVSEPHIKKPEESPAYLARCTHKDGNIIITADYLGCIKVFRQDCAYQKRRSTWETASTFSKKMLGRSSSIVTRHSNGSRSRRNSVSQNSLHSNGRQGRPSEHILSWRETVNSNVSLDGSLRNGSKTSRSERSVSPTKVTRVSLSNPPSQTNLANTARQQQYAASPLPVATSGVYPSSPSLSAQKGPNSANQPPTPGFSIYTVNNDDPLKLDPSGRSYQFWNVSSWKAQSPSGRESTRLGDDLSPMMQKKASIVSRLSSDETSSAENESGSDESALKCTKCGGKDFRARRVSGKGQRLACTKCGTTVD
jgi:WD repeat-containing protein 44